MARFLQRNGWAKGNRLHVNRLNPRSEVDAPVLADRLAAAELKRARKNAKRVGLVTLPASDATDTVELPK